MGKKLQYYIQLDHIKLRNNSWKPYVYIVFTTGLDSKRLKDVILEVEIEANK